MITTPPSRAPRRPNLTSATQSEWNRWATRLFVACAWLLPVARPSIVSPQAGARLDSSGVIRGKVIDPQGKGIGETELGVRPSGPTTVSTTDGSFLLRGVPRERISLLVRRIGYGPVVIEVDLTTE